MSYPRNNYNRNNQAGYYPQPQGHNNYNPQRQGVPYNNQPPPVFKSSGAVYSKIKNGNFEGDTIVNAWRKTKFGLMTATVTPYAGKSGAGTDLVQSDKHEYRKMLCTIKNASLGTSQMFHVLMNTKTKVISISEMSLCITPNGSGTTRSGKRVSGYFGRNFKK